MIYPVEGLMSRKGMKVTHCFCSWVFAADRRWCQEAVCLQQTDVGVRRQALVSSRQEGELQNEPRCRKQGVI